MRLDDERESSNIENRRGEGGGGMGFGGGGGGGGMVGMLLPLIMSRFGIGGLVVVGVGMLLLGMNPLNLIGMGGGGGAPTTQRAAPDPNAPKSSSDQFVSRVLGTTEDTWAAIFKAQGAEYPQPRLVLFQGGVQSACGSASSASGPFYCPGDNRIYLDTAFFDELSRRFGAPGDFAAAYVIAHEVGHHVQNVTGQLQKASQLQARGSQSESNLTQVKVELQADCFAGVWASKNRDVLDSGDFAEGVRAAQAIGDDTLQKQSTGRVVPDSFTHGSAEQRVRWLTRGFESGNVDDCDTFREGVRL